MSSKFLSGGQTDLTDGSAQINIATAIVQNLLPNLPVRTSAAKQLTSGLISLSDCSFTPVTSPFPGNFQVGNLTTAYNTTPVDLNAFIASTLTDISSLQSDTQYITASPGTTNISSLLNLSSNDIRAAQYQDPTGSTFIDMSTPGEVNVSATTFDFNGDPVVTSSGLSSYLRLDGTSTMLGALDMGNQNINNVQSIIPELAIGSELGSNSLPFDTIYLSGNVTGQTYSRSVDNIVSCNAGATASNFPIFSGATGKVIIDSGIPSSALSGRPFLPLAGGSMTGSIAMGTNNLTNVGTLSGASNSRTADNIVSCGSTAGSNNVAIFSGTSGKIIQDSGIDITTIIGGPFLELAGGTGNTMTGDIYLGNHNLVNVGTISGLTGSTLADNIVSNTFTAVNQNLASFNGTTGKVIKDSGLAVNQVVVNITDVGVTGGNLPIFTGGTGQQIKNSGVPYTLVVTNNGTSTTNHIATFADNTGKVIQDSGASLSQYLPLIGGTANAMTGDIYMGGHNLQNTGYIGINTVNNNVIIGDGTTLTSSAPNVQNVFIGHNNSGAGFGTVLIGDSNTESGVGDAFILGNGCTASGSQISMMGLNSSVTGTNCYSIGDANTISGSVLKTAILGYGNTASVSGSFIIGNGATNSISNSMLLGNSSIVNVRPNNNNTCDLGMTSNYFNHLYINNVIQSTPSYCSIYNTAATALSMVATTTRTLPMVYILNSQSSDFTATLATGIITYTGTSTKLFRISASICWTETGASQTIQLGISKNSSLTFQARVQCGVFGNTSEVITESLNDIYSLATNDTITLIGNLSNGATASITYQYCNICITQV